MAARPCVTNQQINSLIARQGVADPRYIYYMISNWSSRLRQDAAGSATPIINKSVLSRYEFDTPPLVQQQAIGEVLGALDDKITADARLVASHEALAYAAFSGLLSDVATAPLSRVAQFVNGRAFTKDASGTGRVVIRIAELNSGIGSATVRNDIDVADIHLARPGDLLFAWSGSLTVHRWFRPEAIVNQHIFKVIPNPGYPMWLVHQLLLRKLDEFRAIAKDKATTMGHIQRRHLDEPVQVPRREEIERVHPLMEGLWFGALAAEQESLKLTELRDTLLPQFMSGRLRVKEAEKQIEAVV
jgi:type I restriction enzyme S subunit